MVRDLESLSTQQILESENLLYSELRNEEKKRAIFL